MRFVKLSRIRSVVAHQRKVATGLLVIMGMNILTPLASYALTSGPVQPETKGFQPAGVSDMVDVQSGNFKYNIPLLDIDGYPINLNYQANAGMDDEASWVGLGWSLTPGAINRQVRGIPDDFSGDLQETDQYTKPKITVGGRLTAKVETFGTARFSGSFSFGVFNDNYTGIGGEFGVNAGISYAMPNDGFLTAGLGVGVLSNTQSGVDATPYVSLSIKHKTDQEITENAGLSAQLGYNTRSGMKSLTLGGSFGGSYNNTEDPKFDENTQINAQAGSMFSRSSSISYNTPALSPSIQVPYYSRYNSFSFDIGGAVFGTYISGGGTGYQNMRKIQKFDNVKPAYGFLYAERGKNDPDALMDFIREKDNPIIPEIPNIAVPVHTPDLWSYDGQTGAGQFKLYRGGTGIFFDNQSSDVADVGTIGADIGIGSYAHGGLTKFDQTSTSKVNKWTESNDYLSKGDFRDPVTINLKDQQVYFKQVGEKTVEDKDLSTALSDADPLAILTGGDYNPNNNTQTHAFARFNVYNKSGINALPNSRTSRRQNRTVITYLTADEAGKGGFDTSLKYYPENDSLTFHLPANNRPVCTDSISRVSSTRRSNHISEITVTDDGGKRMVYGMPVYNISQDEYSFALGKNYSAIRNQVPTPGTINDPQHGTLGIDAYYQREHKSAYATSFLLTAILSPDYVDKTGNGISDDDLGTALKFNYSKSAHLYKWRTPYENATLNKCLLADPDDDKGSIVYGTKELCYISSIESKTKVAYFITQNRRDGLGASNWQNGGIDPLCTQKLLKEIRLYSKADMSRPIKVIKFQYDYELCRGIPNSLDPGSSNPALGGKLTLKRVWFEYGNSDKGKYHPYIFDYKQSTSAYKSTHTGADSILSYNYLSTDRWGVYKKNNDNNLGTNESPTGTSNETYPYSNQNKSVIDENAALWHLKQIILPTGGMININYESNDYAYVQDKKAMVMTGIVSLLANPNTPIDARFLNRAKGISVNIGNSLSPPTEADPTRWFKDNFLNGSDYIYTKMYIRLATGVANSYGRDYDYVPVYCKVRQVSINSGIANIMFADMTEGKVTTNPISIAAWQRLKNEYPRYAYPGFDNRVQSENASVSTAVSAIVQAAKNLKELQQSFYEKANARNYASSVDLNQSFVKLVKTDGHKMGGGVRVKQISITDQWQEMVNNSEHPAISSSYGQSYDYTTIEQNQSISSGVATYEPAIGNDENALKEPILYGQNIKGGINNYFSLEKPFCESLYPSPSVGYSKVTVKDLGADHQPSKKTGSVINEFYTAKDFPVKVKVIPIDAKHYTPSSQFSLTRTKSMDYLTLSQGYSIELNDMHGKPKSTRVLNQTDAEISSTTYYYKVDGNGQLDNHADILGTDGHVVSNVVLGRDIEFFTDFREQTTKNKGSTINIGFDVIPFFIFPLFLPHFPGGENNDDKQFRSVCALKTVQTYGLIDHVVKTQNGSSVTTQNLVYDGLTGDPLITKTQNEFKNDIYSVSLPAYWMYNGMGGAYQNLGTYFSSFKTNAHGEINSDYAAYVRSGDEILDTKSGARFWVIDNQAFSGSGNTKKLIKRDGSLNISYTPEKLVKIIRSGYRNLLTANAGSVVCLGNPLVTDNNGTHLRLTGAEDLTSLKVINASASTFDENWAVENGANHHTAYFRPIVDNNAENNNLVTTEGSSSTVYCESGALIKETASSSPVVNNSLYWQNSLTRSGIWVGDPLTSSTSIRENDYAGFDTCITIPVTKTYYVGYTADNYIQVTIDGDTLKSTKDYYHWQVVPVTLTAGKHRLNAYFYNATSTWGAGGPCTAGVEIYDNTYAQLTDPGFGSANAVRIFSTEGFKTDDHVRSYLSDEYLEEFIYRYTYEDGSFPDLCSPLTGPAPAGIVINPFIQGYMGNWRPYQTKVFQKNRAYADLLNPAQKSVNVKNAGFISGFYGHWYFNDASKSWDLNPNPGAAPWTVANTVTLYDKYGQQLENRDALGRYSAANFDFFGELPSAVASNAMNREVYACTFEDVRFAPGHIAADTIDVREFMLPSTKTRIKSYYDSTYAHSGNYSVKLPYSDSLVLTTIVHNNAQKTQDYLKLDENKQYLTKIDAGLYPNGFEPKPKKEYFFSVWVHDGDRYTKFVHLTARANKVRIPLTCKTIVENWKLMEGTFTTTEIGPQEISIRADAGYTNYIDDIRIHPSDAHVKTYAYDDKTMRLMAELDENAFATFYEYDDEGLLIRVKKETERGIMTIKESRSSYKKNNLP